MAKKNDHVNNFHFARPIDFIRYAFMTRKFINFNFVV